MIYTKARSYFLLILGIFQACIANDDAICKCIARRSCWPAIADWNELNATVAGKLLTTHPVAVSCYPGVLNNLEACKNVVDRWTNASFQANQPLGLDLPTNLTCPPVNYTAGKAPGKCTLGPNPSYAINATSTQDVAAGLVFAAHNNVRVVIKTTGHDLLGRSEGSDSLLVWLRYLRTGIQYQPRYKSSNNCTRSTWRGSAFKIGGGYTWADVYTEAIANNVVVVGGGTPSVSCIGGWMQGGGHGPASRQFGLGADQVLEAEVVLANGSLVTANPCSNPDLFFAIRGGGPGTYGVVVSTTIKAWPMVHNIAVQHLAITPTVLNDTNYLLDAITTMFSSYPDLNDAGFAGYGTWSTNAPAPIFPNSTSGFVHGIYMFSKTIADAQAAFAPVRAKLALYNNTQLLISESYAAYPDYWTFFYNESNVNPPAGGSFIAGSHLFDRPSVQNTTLLRSVISTLAGSPGEGTLNSVELVSGGAVFTNDSYSGLLPAWRISYFNNIVSRSLPPDISDQARVTALDDITHVKVKAMKDLAPHTGMYMNEASPFEPDFETQFYGANYERLRAVKRMYDPEDLFYCRTCVGSGEWEVKDDGSLCRAEAIASL